MTERERWEEMAHELGTWDLEYDRCANGEEMVLQDPPHVGLWVDTEAACKRIAELEAESNKLRDILKRAHEVIAGSSTVPVPGAWDDELAMPIEVLRAQRDNALRLAERTIDEVRAGFMQRLAGLEAMHDAQQDRIQELTKALAQQLDANTRILEEREELRSENHRLMTCIKQTMRDQGGDDD